MRASWIAPSFQRVRAFWLSLGASPAGLLLMQTSGDHARAHRLATPPRQRPEDLDATAGGAAPQHEDWPVGLPSEDGRGDAADAATSTPTAAAAGLIWPSTPPRSTQRHDTPAASPTSVRSASESPRSGGSLAPLVGAARRRADPPAGLLGRTAAQIPGDSFESAVGVSARSTRSVSGSSTATLIVRRRLSWSAEAAPGDVEAAPAARLDKGLTGSHGVCATTAAAAAAAAAVASDGHGADDAGPLDVDLVDPTGVRPGLGAQLLRVPFTLSVFVMLYLLFHLFSLAADISSTNAQAQAVLARTCARAEVAASAVASFPHALSLAVNADLEAAAATVTNETVAAVLALGVLVDDALATLVLGRVNSVLCAAASVTNVAELAVTWYSHDFLDAVNTQLDAFSTALNGATGALQSALNGAAGTVASFASGYDSIANELNTLLPGLDLPVLGLVNLPDVTIPSVPVLRMPAVPVPSLAPPQQAIDNLITDTLSRGSLAAVLRQALLTDGGTLANLQLGPLPEAAEVNVTFCDRMTLGQPVAAVAASLEQALAVAMVLTAVAVVAMSLWEGLRVYWRVQRRQREERLLQQLRSASRLRRTWAAFARFVWYPPALACCVCGLVGFATLEGVAGASRGARFA